MTNSKRLETLQENFGNTVVEYIEKYAQTPNISHTKIAAEMENVVAVAEWSADQGNRDIANKLIGTLTRADNFVQERGYVYELLLLRGFASSFTTAFPYSAESQAIDEDDDEIKDFSPAPKN